jgi:hypothetical protein
MDDDPIELALRPQTSAAASSSSSDPIEQALNPATRQASPRTPIVVPDSPRQASLPALALHGALDVAGGVGETLTSGALGFAGQLAGGAASYAGRFLPGGDWDRAQRWANKVQQEVSTAGGLYGEPETTTGQTIQKGMNWIGGKISAFASGAGQKTLDITGSPTLASTVDATLQALPQLAAAKLAQRMSGGTSEPEAIPQPAVAGFAPDSIVKAPQATGQAVVGGTSAPEVALAAKSIQPTVETPSVPIPEAIDHAPGDLGPALQAQREAILARVGHQSARTSAVTGNGPATMFDFDSAKSLSEAGQMMRQQIDSETAANAAFASKIQQATGGTAGLDQASLNARGDTIDAARAGLQQWHDNQVASQYAAARTALGDTPVKLNSLAEIAPDPAKVSGTPQGLAFKAQLDKVMQSLGIADPQGNILSTSVNNAERLRQWMNSSWKPETSGFITELKNALDTDVTQAAGKDVFEQARAARTLQAQQLQNPAFERIAGLSDAKNFEAIPDAVARLPSDQLAHVVNVFSNMPEGLQPLGTQALQEIAGHYANRIVEAGTPKAVGGSWSDIGVSKYLQNNNARLAQVFTPEGMNMIGDLNQAGKITAMDKRYIGAAGQSQNFLQRGLVYALPKLGGMAGGAAGSLLAGPLGAGSGALAGEAAMSQMSQKMQAAYARKQMQQRIKPLGPGPVPAAQP